MFLFWCYSRYMYMYIVFNNEDSKTCTTVLTRQLLFHRTEKEDFHKMSMTLKSEYALRYYQNEQWTKRGPVGIKSDKHCNSTVLLIMHKQCQYLEVLDRRFSMKVL